MKKIRTSNIELLRIVSMFRIMVLHVNYGSLGWPQQAQEINHPIEMYGRFFTEQIAIASVDVFILISGWFGMNFKLERIFQFLFQIFLVSVIVLIIFLFYSSTSLSPNKLFKSFFSFWFIWSYLLLYILSPTLNSFMQDSSKRKIETLLIALYIFQTADLFFSFSNDIKRGFSVINFIGLYILAQYIKKYFQFNLRLTSLLFVYSIVLFIPPTTLFVAGKFLPNFTFNRLLQLSTAYTNPIVIIESILLLFIFLKIKIQSKFINYVATGSFTVYLLHQNILIRPYFFKYTAQIYNNHVFLTNIILILLFLLIIYIVALIIDIPRIYLDKFITSKKRK